MSQARTHAAARPAGTAAPVSSRSKDAPARLSNQALQRSAASGRAPKLPAGRTDDPAESAARSLAERITGRGAAPCACGGTCAACHGSAGRISSGGRTAAIAGGFGEPLELSQRVYFEPRLGMPLNAVRVHRDRGAALMAQNIGAQAFAIGSDIGFGSGQYAPETQSGRRLLAHELAHVALGHSGLRREPLPFTSAGGFPSPATGQRARCPGGCHEPNPPPKPNWDLPALKGPGVPIKSPRELLGEQPKTIEKELEGYEQNILGSRSAIFDQLEKDRMSPPVARAFGGFDAGNQSLGAALPPDLKRRYAAAALAATAMQAAVDAAGVPSDPRLIGFARIGDIPIEVQEDTRLALTAYYLALEEFAAAVDREQIARNQRITAAKEQEELQFSRRAVPPCPNCHTQNPPPRVSFVPAPRFLSPVPAQIAKNLPGVMGSLAAAATAPEWKQVETDFKGAVAMMDGLLIAALPEGAKQAETLKYLTAQKADLEKFYAAHPSAVPIPAVFYPTDRWVTEKVPGGPPGATVQIPQAIPWRFYLYHSNDLPTVQRTVSAGPGQWILTDMTSPRHYENFAPTFGPGEALFDPPKSLFEQLNTKYRFPEGKLYWTNPSGVQGELETTEPATASDWLGWIGMGLAAIALIAGTVLTFGAAAGVTIPALGGIATAAGIGAAGFGIASTVTGMREKEQYGLLTEEDKERAILSIALDVIGALALGLGRLATVAEAGIEAAEAGTKVSRFASTLAALNGRYFLMITRAAAVSKVAGLGADVTQLVTVTSDFIKAFNAIRSQPGLSDADRDKALVKLVATSLLTGAMLTISVHGGLKDAKGGILRISGADEEGRFFVEREARAVARGKPGAPEAAPPATIRSHLETGEPPPAPGWSRKAAGPQFDPDLPEGRVEVRIIRDESGRILDAETHFGRGATKESKEIHDNIAKMVRAEGEELRALVHESRKQFGGEPPPLELQLELKKLFDEMAAAEKKLGSGTLKPGQAKDVTDKLKFLQGEIDKVKAAIADPALRSAYPKGIVGLPVKPAAVPTRGKGGELVKPRGYPDPPAGHMYYLRDNGEFGIRPKAGYKGAAKFGLEEVEGKFVVSNREQIEKYTGLKLTKKLRAELEAQGYIFQENDIIRRPAGHGAAGKPRMMPLELDSQGRIRIVEGAETLGEAQARLREALPKAQQTKLAKLEASAAAGDKKVVLVEGLYDTGVTWDKVLTKTKQKELKGLLRDNGVPDADIDRLIDALVTKKGTIKVVLGTDPVRAAAKYRGIYAEEHGAPRGKVEIHHGDPLYLGGGHDPTSLFGLKQKPHDALHAFFDDLTLPAGSRLGPVKLQPTVIQTKVKGLAKPAAAIVDPATGEVRFDFLK
jgi:mono/diheme cytochrome c family protein